MTIRYSDKHGKWLYDFRLNGRRYASTCIDPDTGAAATSKTSAAKIEAKIKLRIEEKSKAEGTDAALSRLRRLAEQKSATYTVTEAFTAYAARKSQGKNWENNRIYVRELVTWFGPFADIRSITDQKVWDYIAWSRQQPVMIYKGGSQTKASLIAKGIDPASLWHPATDGRRRSDATINRYLVALRETLGIAHAIKNQDGTAKVLPIVPHIPDLAEAKALPRPIDDDTLWQMVTEAPAHLAWGILLARLMGFRRGEMFGLRTVQVDLTNRGVWLLAKDTKAGRDEFVPANDDAVELLTYLLAESRARRSDYLITFRRRLKSEPGQPLRFSEPRPVANPKRAWARVLRELGLTGVYKFHNTKASFVSAVGANASAAVTQKLARHKDHRTTERYLLVNDQAARAAVAAAGLTQSHSSRVTVGQNAESGQTGRSSKHLNFRDKMVGATGFEPATPSPPD